MSVGSTLAEARIRAGLTLEDVAEHTRIRRTLIENIEADDFHACGGDFYARGHVKSIAQMLHLDPAPLLAEFDGDHVDPETPTASGVLDVAHLEVAQRGSTARRPNWSVAMAVALAAVLAVAAFQVVGSGGGSEDPVAGGDPVVSQQADGDGSAPQDTAGVEPTDQPSTAPTDAIAAVPDDGVTVVVTAVEGRSWVSATGKSTGELFQSVMDSGQEQTVRDDRQVKLVIGNAGAVRLLVNGQDVGAPGGTGEVVRLTFGPGDPSGATG